MPTGFGAWNKARFGTGKFRRGHRCEPLEILSEKKAGLVFVFFFFFCLFLLTTIKHCYVMTSVYATYWEINSKRNLYQISSKIFENV